MPEPLNLPADGRELELFESFEGLEIPEEPRPIITSTPGSFGMDIVNRYNFNWNNKHFDWTFQMPDTKLVREADGSVIFVGLPYSFTRGFIPTQTRITQDRASVIGAVELDPNQFAPGVKYSVKIKVFARVHTGNLSERPVAFGMILPFQRKLREKRNKFFPAKICFIKIYALDDSSIAPVLVETFRESSDSKEITDVREELSISSSEIFPRKLRIEFSFEGSEIFFDKVAIQKLEA